MDIRCRKAIGRPIKRVVTKKHRIQRMKLITPSQYRVIHDLWTLLQKMVSSVCMIKNVNINMCRILIG